jgi:hypothetical protein
MQRVASQCRAIVATMPDIAMRRRARGNVARPFDIHALRERYNA